MDALVIGVVGNPNCGKTTLFNALTGARQRVGNWSGVTVDRKEGSYTHEGRRVRVVDLPGVYSMGAITGMDSLDERIARDFVLSGEADVIVNIVDAANLERNLYLTAQLTEMRVPMVVALNMVDVARTLEVEVDPEALERRLGCPVVTLVAARGEGIAGLKAVVAAAAEAARAPDAAVAYPGDIERAVEAILPVVSEAAAKARVDPRWLAVRLLEGDDRARAIAGDGADDLLAPWLQEIEAGGEDADILIADGRYAFANEAARRAVRHAGRVARTTSDAIDRVVANRWLGVPIFFGVMYLMFMFTINLGGAFIDFFDIAAKAVFVDGLGRGLLWLGSPEWFKVIVADGIGGGIEVVATFIPIIGFLYLFLSLLEDSGYMARAAFVVDRFIRAIGLPGKAFVPLIVGFGCNVPAVMATRTLESQRDRMMTVAMAPFMSCGARLAVYALFAAAFFPVGGQNVVFLLYLIGIAAAVLTGLVLRHSLLRGETSPFLIELPPYHVPRPRGVLIHAWNRLKNFVFGAGQVIVVVVAVLSFLNSWGTDGTFGNENSEHSVLSAIGRTLVPVFEPMGIEDDNWPATVGIFTGIFAKEAVVGTLDSLYTGLAGNGAAAAGSRPEGVIEGLGRALASVPANLAGLADLLADPLGLGAAGVGSVEAVTAAQDVGDATFGAMEARFDGRIGAFAYLLFILLYVPCVATLGAIQREAGPRWTAFVAVWTTAVAYAAAVGFYQIATFARHPVGSTAWSLVLIATFVAIVAAMRRLGQRQTAAPIPVSPAE
jgi:ferrous iron transport protein B